MAASTFAKKAGGTKRILLLDKKEPWKEPIYCAEAVSADRLGKLVPIDRSWVRCDVSGIYFTSPKGYRADFYSKNCGLILDRAKFHHALSDACVDSGVECHYDVLAKGVTRKDDGSWSVAVKPIGGEEESLSALAIIDATGPGARLTRGIGCLDGIESGDVDLEPAVFALADGIEHDKDHIELFFGSEFKNGYGWIFPRDGKTVNIGFVLGKGALNGVSLRTKLKDMITSRYPQAVVKGIYGGMIASGQSEKPMAKSGLFKAGDAASCVNPISRSGIVEALLCGKIVAESVVDWLEADSAAARERIESSVIDRWMAALGKAHLQLSRAKNSFYGISDSQFDRAAKSLSKLPREKQTLFRIFFTVLWVCPSLIWKMRSFIR